MRFTRGLMCGTHGTRVADTAPQIPAPLYFGFGIAAPVVQQQQLLRAACAHKRSKVAPTGQGSDRGHPQCPSAPVLTNLLSPSTHLLASALHPTSILHPPQPSTLNLSPSLNHSQPPCPTPPPLLLRCLRSPRHVCVPQQHRLLHEAVTPPQRNPQEQRSDGGRSARPHRHVIQRTGPPYGDDEQLQGRREAGAAVAQGCL